MKKLIIVCLLLIVVIPIKAELITLVTTSDSPTNSFILQAGDGARLEWWNGLTKIQVQTSNSLFEVVSPYFYTTANGGKFAVGGPATVTIFGNTGTVASFEIIRLINPNTANIIPKGQGAIVSLQSTYDLGGSWSTLFSQSFTNNTSTNQFFKFIMSAP